MELNQIARHLEHLGKAREHANYDTALLKPFHNNAESARLVQEAKTALALLDAIDGDAARRAAAVAALPPPIP